MYINKLEIENFRAFQDDKTFKFKFSPHINCISGHNGIGKSTILAIISNCGELKKKDGEQLNGNAFRGEYSQVIKGDENFDRTGKICTLHFSDLPPSTDKDNPFVTSLSYRATFQTAETTQENYQLIDKDNNTYQQTKKIEKKKRYRLIPSIQSNRKTEKKLNWPTIYLGLSRLFPIGESEDSDKASIPQDISDLIQEKHKEILSSHDEYLDSSQVHISDTTKKSGFGVETDNYSYLSNSSGQDNLGQILLGVYSFQRLKENYEDYAGGVYLIDEIDATLHPAAQNKLINFLLEKSIELDLQIFFTTHSNSLLEYLNFRRNNPKNRKSITVNYLDNTTGKIIVQPNPKLSYIKNNLLETYSIVSQQKKVPIFTEDKTGQWLLNRILEAQNFQNINNIQYTNSSISWTKIIKFIKDNYEIFKDSLFFLDPDLSKTDNSEQLNNMVLGTFFYDKINTKNGNIFYLNLDNENDYIEKIFWDYMSSFPPDHEIFLLTENFNSNYSIQSMLSMGPDSHHYEHYEENLKIKKWFEQNLHYVNLAFPYWHHDNKEEISDFYQTFTSAFYEKLNN